MNCNFVRFLFAFLLAFASFITHAQNDWISNAEKRLATLGGEINKSSLSLDVLGNLVDEVSKLRAKTELCTSQGQVELDSIKEKLAALGEVKQDQAVDPEIEQKRSKLDQERVNTERRLANCRLLTLTSQDIAEQLQKKRQEELSAALLVESDPIWRVVKANLRELPKAWQQLPELWTDADWRSGLISALSLIIIVGILLLPTQKWRRTLKQQLPPTPLQGLWLTLQGRAVAVVLFLALGVGFYSSHVLGLAILFFAIAASLLLAPLAAFLVCRGALNCDLALPTRLLTVVSILGLSIVLADLDTRLPLYIYLLLRAFLALLWLSGALWLLWALTERTGYELVRSLRLPLSLAFVSAPVAEWFGYRVLADYLGLGAGGSAVAIWLIFEFRAASNRFFVGLELGESGSARRFKTRFRLPENATLGGFVWFRRLIGWALLGALFLILAKLWGVSDADLALAANFLQQGFTLGGVRLVPLQLLFAVLLLYFLVRTSAWLKRQLEDRWLENTSLDKGAKQSIVALTSYSIIGIGILTALSMAGIEFQNLALVAGALSVGIGFGLQNIVSNFISGIILLFERPVRPGDWVVVGQTEGYVQKVSIRYTQIRTFDRADVLVPNSELISSHVTNWQLTNTYGRLKVQVGVAYGSDIRKVRDILLKIAKDHPFVLVHDPLVPPPKVYFLEFGDSALVFELWAVVKDVDYRLSVKSDIMFALDDAFAAEGIEIPFPQRVIHTVLPAEPTNKAPD